jgi:hypothetical protein
MSSLLPHPSEQDTAAVGAPADTSHSPDAVHRNGAAGTNTAAPPDNKAAGEPAPDPAQAPGEGQQRPHVERAEEIVDRVAAKVAETTSVWGRKLLRFASRVKESAQDFWAEAQSIRRGDQP